jgi:hypothetical protein
MARVFAEPLFRALVFTRRTSVFQFGSPSVDDGLEVRCVAQAVGVLVALGDQTEHDHHVITDHGVHGPQVGQVEAAARTRVPPGQQEVGNPSALTRVTFGDVDEAFERLLFLIGWLLRLRARERSKEFEADRRRVLGWR